MEEDVSLVDMQKIGHVALSCSWHIDNGYSHLLVLLILRHPASLVVVEEGTLLTLVAFHEASPHTSSELLPLVDDTHY